MDLPQSGLPSYGAGVLLAGRAQVQTVLQFGEGGEEGGWGGPEFLEVVGMVARVCHTCLPARMFACTGKASGEVE